jgi:hypothetical protein
MQIGTGQRSRQVKYKTDKMLPHFKANEKAGKKPALK